LSPALARALTEQANEIGRRIGILVDRKGHVERVIVGDARRVHLPDLGPRRGGAARFRGVRLVLAPLNPEGLTHDELTDLSLLRLDAVIGVEVKPGGLPGKVAWAWLMPPEAGALSGAPYRVEQVASVHGWSADFTAFIQDLEAQYTKSPHLRTVEGSERAILVGATLGNPKRARRGMDELTRLAGTAGLTVVDSVLTRRDQIDGRTFIGQGKLEELVIEAMHRGADVLVFDRELSPSQLRNIAQTTELKVLDRTQLILDIFAQHATSKAGKLQVELAQLRYRMPRLAIMTTAMSRLTGGIGGRGPGETRLEINKRRAQERLTRLERDLDQVAAERALRRKRRKKSGIPVASIVGYTNAGKSTLLNRLTRSSILAEDKLFATLDPTSRRLRFPEQREMLVTDTVGFIQDLPDTLVRAFRATLEELEEADLLLHVADASDPEVDNQVAAVDAILRSLALGDVDPDDDDDDEPREAIPHIRVWNKTDAADPQTVAALVERYGGVAVSAVTGDGLVELLDKIERTVFLRRAAGRAAREAEAEA
jgi:GTP-binding protein HflX